MTANRFDLVIFDCDGVLVDSEAIGHEVLATILAGYGVHFDASPAQPRYEGMATGDIRREVEETYGIRMPDDWTGDYYARLIRALRERVRPVDGVGDVLECLRRLRIPVCAASQGPLAKTEASLTGAGLWSGFAGRVYSAKSVARPKPAPDLFLHAARSENVAPERCAVIEDSAPGVEAGLAAGMTVFAYCPEDGKAARMRGLGAIPFHAMQQLADIVRCGQPVQCP